MAHLVKPWAATPDERLTVESNLRGLIGQILQRVNYLDPDTSDPWRIKAHAGFDQASMGIELHWDHGGSELKWIMAGEREGLALVFDQTEADLRNDRVQPVQVPDESRWRKAIGAVVTAVGVSWHQPTAEISAIWSVRLEFSFDLSVVVALGEWRDGAIHYIPDQIVVIFDTAIAQRYVIPAGEEPAWGRNARSGRDRTGSPGPPDLHGLYLDVRQVELKGNPPGLIVLAEALASGQPRTVGLGEPADIGAWDGWLTEVEVEPVVDTKVKVERNGRKLKFVGDPGGLASLARSVRALVSGELVSHIHAEYYSGHPFFDEATVPLVVTLPDSRTD